MTLNVKNQITKRVEKYLEIAAVADDIERLRSLITEDVVYTLSTGWGVFRGGKAMAAFAKTRTECRCLPKQI